MTELYYFDNSATTLKKPAAVVEAAPSAPSPTLSWATRHAAPIPLLLTLCG